MLTTNDSVEMDSFLAQGGSARKPHPTRTAHKYDYAIGIGFIIIVTLLWTFGSFVTQVGVSSCTVGQHLFCYNRTYIEVATINHSCMPESFILHFFLHFSNQNFRLSYMNQSMHSLCLILVLIRYWWNHYKKERYVAKLCGDLL